MPQLKQRGSILLYGLLALAVVTICGGMVYTYQHAIVRAERAEADNTTLRTVNQEVLADNAGLREQKARTDVLLAARQTQRNTADNIERAVNAKLAEIFRNDPKAREWRDNPVPDSVLRGLRSESPGPVSKDGKGSAAGNTDTSKRGP